MSAPGPTAPRFAVFDLEELQTSPTVALFEGAERAGVGITMFIVHSVPGALVELHTHPYTETFVLLEGRVRWTAGDDVVELDAGAVVTVPPDTVHGFRNTGDISLRMVTVHESGVLIQHDLDQEPA
ncbi:MAG: cupin domain-containing protein [Solirubrobacteraceae bacterium]|nr:cupin domain-containing protein [Solirubrobacteraceae bacterium]